MSAVKKEVVDLSQLLNENEASGSNAFDTNTITTATAQLIVDCHCKLGEGIVFDDMNDTIMWTDILGSRFHMLELNYQHVKNTTFSTHQLPKMLCSFGMLLPSSLSSSEINKTKNLPLLCAWQDGFQLYDIVNGIALSDMSIGEDVNPIKGPTRLNDGRVDPTGNRFVCGGYYGELPDTKMKIFKVEQQQQQQQGDDQNVKQLHVLHHEVILDDIQVTNSICWSPDGNIMYLADSPTRQIHSYKYNKASGSVSEKTLVHTKTETMFAVPDGSCVDEQGYIWNAVWRDGHAPGMVQRIHPVTGAVVFTVQMPNATSQVSCCCFGGKDLNILFITTASVGISTANQKEPHAGGLYAVKIPFVKGRLESRLKFQVY